MSLSYNGTEVQSITYNGADVQSITMDGVEVWSAFPSDLSKATPEQIQYAAQHDLAASLWDIGDYFEMTLNGSNWGTSSNISFNNYVVRCELIGINHNNALEGSHLLHFQMGKNSDGINIGFYPFKMSSDGIVWGGWKDSPVRNQMNLFYRNIIPNVWKNVIATTIKYTNNSDRYDKESYVTSTEDKFFLLSEYEIFGVRNKANEYEQNKQQQYAYYINGNSKIRYIHDNVTQSYIWWTRSCVGHMVCIADTAGSSSYSSSSVNYLAVPAFSIG